MPSLYSMDDYEKCMLQPGGTYCLVDYDLTSNSHSDLLQFIQKYRLVVWLAFPLGVAVVLLYLISYRGYIFYIDGFQPSVFLKVAYASLYRPLFQIFVLTIIIGTIFKLETAYRSIIEWRGFTWAGRVAYSAFLLHSLFQRGLAGSQTTLLVISDYFIAIFLSASIFLSFLCGAVLWLLVEAPVASLIKLLLNPRSKSV